MIVLSDRTTKVTLTAQVTGYIAGMNQARGATDGLRSDSAKLAEQQAAVTATARDASVALAAVGAIAAAGVVLAVKKFADFDKAMSGVQAATQETTFGMGELRDAALEAGTNSQYSATQAAQAITELGKAGLSTSDILGGALSASLNLAASDNLDLATAAGIAATTAKQFGLEGKDLAHVSDLLAAGANKALGGVEDLANGLKFVGPVAHSMGISVDETTAALAAFASQGILGEQAGTSLRGVLSSLTSPSSMAKDELAKLGVTLYDSTGKFLGLANMAGELGKAYAGMNDQQRDASLGVIFGNQQVTAARLLYQQGAEGIKEWTDAVNDQGFAAKVAAQQMDNLEGDITKLTNSLTTGFIKSGSVTNDLLRNITQSTTGLVEGFNNAGPVVQGGALALAAVTASAALLGGGFLILLPKINQTRLAMQAMNISGKTLAKGFGKGGLVFLALTAAAGALSGMGSMSQLAADEIANLDAAVKTDNIKKLNDEFVDAYGNTSSFAQALDNLFTSNFFTSYQGGPAQVNGAIKTLSAGLIDMGAWADTDRAKFDHLGEALGGLAKQDLPSATEQFNRFLDMTDGSDESIRQLLSAFPQYKAALIDLAAGQGVTLTEQELFNLAVGKGDLAMKLGKISAEKHAVSLGDVGAAAQDASGLVDELSDAITNFGKAQFDVNATTRAFEQAVDDAAAAVEANGATLDVNTQQGRDNQAALDAIAQSANEAASAMYAQTGSVDATSDALMRGREQYVLMGIRLGLTREAAEKYADALIATPEAIATEVSLNVDPATAALNKFISDITSRRPVMHIEGRIIATGDTQFHASGGTVTGSGGPKSDSNLAFLSKGEEVIQEPYATRFRPQLKAMNRGMVPAFAGGGTFSPAPTFVPAPQFSSSSRPMSIEGTLDLGNGLSGFVRGVLTDEVNRAVPASYGVK